MVDTPKLPILKFTAGLAVKPNPPKLNPLAVELAVSSPPNPGRAWRRQEKRDTKLRRGGGGRREKRRIRGIERDCMDETRKSSRFGGRGAWQHPRTPPKNTHQASNPQGHPQPLLLQGLVLGATRLSQGGNRAALANCPAWSSGQLGKLRQEEQSVTPSLGPFSKAPSSQLRAALKSPCIPEQTRSAATIPHPWGPRWPQRCPRWPTEPRS